MYIYIYIYFFFFIFAKHFFIFILFLTNGDICKVIETGGNLITWLNDHNLPQPQESWSGGLLKSRKW